ncbi:unnamed protein product [Caenorhabditis angaria]|uniref:Serpin domain-containing protein n=1 Tax=Caenorhabditis angaria TaxID=860376 RepID=A0A9P1IRS1_9PELO|nr:unnamed protein product [Caenorhabditis angaria]
MSLKFCLDLLDHLNLSESTIFSPSSISLALSLVHLAAEGKTKQELRKVLVKDSENDDEIQTFHSNLYKYLNNSSSGCENLELLIVNHIFTNSIYPIKQKYLDNSSELYSLSASPLDFTDSQNSADKINEFVKIHTKNFINNIVKSDEITDDIVAILMNVIYFKAKWLHKFNSEHSYIGDFNSNGNIRNNIDYLCEPSGIEFILKINISKTGLEEAVKTLTVDQFKEILENQKTENLNIHLPKFQMERKINLNEILKSLGVVEAFSKDSANLSNLSDDIWISKITHKAKIEIDEDGTTAAAVTTIVMKKRSKPAVPKVPILFKADHPFLFVLAKTSFPIFIGTYV